jgi:hypothetical protein
MLIGGEWLEALGGEPINVLDDSRHDFRIGIVFGRYQFDVLSLATSLACDEFEDLAVAGVHSRYHLRFLNLWSG